MLHKLGSGLSLPRCAPLAPCPPIHWGVLTLGIIVVWGLAWQLLTYPEQQLSVISAQFHVVLQGQASWRPRCSWGREEGEKREEGSKGEGVGQPPLRVGGVGSAVKAAELRRQAAPKALGEPEQNFGEQQAGGGRAGPQASAPRPPQPHLDAGDNLLKGGDLSVQVASSSHGSPKVLGIYSLYIFKKGASFLDHITDAGVVVLPEGYQVLPSVWGPLLLTPHWVRRGEAPNNHPAPPTQPFCSTPGNRYGGGCHAGTGVVHLLRLGALGGQMLTSSQGQKAP